MLGTQRFPDEAFGSNGFTSAALSKNSIVLSSESYSPIKIHALALYLDIGFVYIASDGLGYVSQVLIGLVLIPKT